MLPPLSLQMIIEDALCQNSTSKTAPLRISINSRNENSIEVINNIQRKIFTEVTDADACIDSLVKRCGLLCRQPVEIHESGNERTIILPLISKTAEVGA